MSPTTGRGGSGAVRVVEHEQAFDVGYVMFLSHGDIDMHRLADQLAVSRATLYRVVGSRDRLLGDILWHLARRTLDRVLVEATAAGLDGVERILTASTEFSRYVRHFEPLQRLLRSDPLTAFRVLFTPAGGVHERFVDAWAEEFAEAEAAGELTLPFEVNKLAYIHVRIGESMLYADVLAGRDPDIELAEMIRRAIFEMPPQR